MPFDITGGYWDRNGFPLDSNLTYTATTTGSTSIPMYYATATSGTSTVTIGSTAWASGWTYQYPYYSTHVVDGRHTIDFPMIRDVAEMELIGADLAVGQQAEADFQAAVAREITFPQGESTPDKRAQQLLNQFLDEQQRKDYEASRSFVVIGQSGERRYRIHHGRIRNIEEIDKRGSVLRRICAHPDLWTPDGDTILAQKLALECNEEAFRRVANFS